MPNPILFISTMYCMVLINIYIFAIQTSLYRMIVGDKKYFKIFVTKKNLFRLNSRRCLKQQFIKQKI